MNTYIRLVLQHPRLVLVCVALLTLLLGFFLKDFRLDASADSLVVEGDPDLEYSRLISARYAAGEFVFVAYTPAGPLFSSTELNRLRTLRDALAAVPAVSGVDSILSLPLLQVAKATLSNVADNLITLEDPGVDLAAAREDLLSSEAYRDVLLSADGLTTALVVNLARDTQLENLLTERSTLRAQQRLGELDSAGQQRLRQVERDYELGKQAASSLLHSTISTIRGILADYEDVAVIHMGGVPMIADDLVTYVRSDIETFGVVMLLFVVAALSLLFHRPRYVLLPLLCGIVIATCVMGVLGWFGWPVTVISSNFISLLLIITVSLTVHLIVRYRELELEQAEISHSARLSLVLQSMLKPCAYTSLTTLVAFGSLVISDIPPIIDFGWMMVIGVFAAFVLTFLLFPAILVLLPALPGGRQQHHALDMTPGIGRFTVRHGRGVMLVSAILGVFSIAGLGLLKVENSFIDYFAEDTAIYQGMVEIDTRLGGTTPLDVVIDLSRPESAAALAAAANPFADAQGEWDDEDGADTASTEAYWFTSDKMQRISAIHAWLDQLPETGKVLSLATLLDIAYGLNDGQPLNSLELGILYSRIPDAYKESLLRPYVSVADDQIRYSIRVRESDPDLVRHQLLDTIRTGLQEQFGLEPSQIHLTGMLVLYNNMLQSLFESQILTLSVVMALIFAMFVVLFRSVYLACIGIIPNLLAALAVLGLMGWLGIPLDMMTITIASISVGIGVDNTIHYIHRFQSNFVRIGTYLGTMHYCHGSIGKAMYYTSFTIIAGFSILVLSNFIPTVYFGLLTSLAMLLALAGSLTLLPQLLVTLKPLGPERASLRS